MKIKVFGEDAREIKEGQIFIARKDSVEGRDIAILEPQGLTSIPDPFED